MKKATEPNSSSKGQVEGDHAPVSGLSTEIFVYIQIRGLERQPVFMCLFHLLIPLFRVLLSLDELVKSHQRGRHSKKLQMQGTRTLRNEAYIEVRRNDER
jgi:hypothetical protein